MKKQETHISFSNLLNSGTCMDVKSIWYKKNCSVYTDDEKPEMIMPQQIDVKVLTRTWKNSKMYYWYSGSG